LAELTSQFYTYIPHAYKRHQVPPPIRDAETLQKKYDLLAVLGDVELANSLIEGNKDDSDEVDNPLDLHYKALNADLEHVDPKSEEFKRANTYLVNTGNRGKLLQLFRVNRHSADERFAEHDAIEHRNLLWHEFMDIGSAVDLQSPSSSEEYYVDRIVDARLITEEGKVEYLIKWKDYPESENTWEPEENVNGCEALKRFHQNQQVSVISFFLNSSFVGKKHLSHCKKKSESRISIGYPCFGFG